MVGSVLPTLQVPSMLIRCLFLAAVFWAAASVHAQPTGGASVSVATVDDSGKASPFRGMLWMPQGAPRGGVVLLHGAAGWNDFREGHYGRTFSGVGYAVLAVDSFGTRGVPQTVSHLLISFNQMARDAFAARAALVERGVPADRVAVMGLSKGGTAAMYAADRFLTPAHDDRFAAAIALYPTCHNRPRSAKPASTMFVALGEKDDLTGVQQCQDFAEAFGKAGGKASVKVYAGAAHGFDGDPANTVPFYAATAESFTRCNVEVEANGRETFSGKTFDPGSAEIMAALRAACVKKGASFWSSARQKEAVTRDVVEFLNVSLAK